MNTLRFALSCLTLLVLCSVVKGAERPPNFVVIFADDQGYADGACFGAKDIKTPNFDRMAAEGTRFTNFYVGQAVCSASRAALLTGCYPTRVSVLGAYGPNSKNALNKSEKIIPEILKTKGYATGMVGKWHLGDKPGWLPPSRGFDEYFGLPYSSDMWPKHPSAKFPDLPLIEGEKTLELNPDQTQLVTRYTEHAVKFIEKNKDHPFFLYFAFNTPHVPLFVSDKFKGKSEHGLYGDVIMEIDWAVGQVLDTLKKNGLDENTFVVFTSDNGPWLLYGDHAGSALPLREGKATSFDGGVREPCLMRWPGKIPAGTVCHEMAWTMDLLPTIAKLAGAEVPADRMIDGKDIWPLISGQPNAKTPHEAYFYYWGHELQGVRSGKWKLHTPHSYVKPEPPGSGGKPGRYATKQIGAELFDLDADPGETTNVADKNPEVVKRLEEFLEKCRDDMGDSKTKREGKNVRPAGKVEEAK